MKELIITNRKGLKMALRVTTNPNADKLVFLEHGLGARKEYPHMLVLEEEFSKHGYNVVNIDATDSLNASDSSRGGVTFSGFYQDLEDVIAWAKEQSFYREPFALAGQSLGAEAVVFYASQNPEKVEFLVPCSFPWIDGKLEFQNNKRTKDILEKGYFDQISKSTGRVLRINRNYLDDLLSYDLTTQVGKIVAETHLIVGLKDSEYHIENNKKLFQLLNCKKSLQMLDGVPHDLANTTEDKEKFLKALEKVLISHNKNYGDCYGFNKRIDKP